MKRFIKKENLGITLIALVITIIVLLILAGISIAQLIGNGLFEKAKLAKEESRNAQEDEEDKIKQYSNEIDSYVDGNRDTVTISKEEYEQLKNANSYSTDEKVIGTWIDGKPLYKKTISVGAVASGTYVDLSSFNIDTLADYDVMAQNANDYLSLKGSYKDKWCNIWVTYNAIPYSNGEDSQRLSISYENFVPTKFTIVLQYTKTTD